MGKKNSNDDNINGDDEDDKDDIPDDLNLEDQIVRKQEDTEKGTKTINDDPEEEEDTLTINEINESVHNAATNHVS